MKEPRYAELFQFFAGEFHEDWPVEAATADEILDMFLEAHPQNKRAHLADLIDAFTAAIPDDRELERALFEELGCYYVPREDARSTRNWLQHVSGRLRAAT